MFPLTPQDGWVSLDEAPGHSVEPDMVRLKPYLARH